MKRNLNTCPTKIKAVVLNRWFVQYYNMPRQHGIHTVKIIFKKTLERIQGQSARFCKKNYYSREPGSITKSLQELGWDTLQTRRKYKIITTLYEMKHNIIDILLNQYMTIVHNRGCSRTHRPNNHVSSN